MFSWRKIQCVVQAGLELQIHLPLPPSANPTGLRHQNQLDATLLSRLGLSCLKIT